MGYSIGSITIGNVIHDLSVELLLRILFDSAILLCDSSGSVKVVG